MESYKPTQGEYRNERTGTWAEGRRAQRRGKKESKNPELGNDFNLLRLRKLCPGN